MFVLIVGGGKAGRFLIKDCLKKGFKVALVEQNREKCEDIEEKYGIKVVQGDGSQKESLQKAGVEEADVVLAVTGDDQDNLVICQLAERQFQVPRTFTSVNTPGNESLFEWLGVNVAVSSTAILSALVDGEVSLEDLKHLLQLRKGDLKMVEIKIKEGSPIAGKKVKEINLPIEAVLITIVRENTPIVPRGNTHLEPGDLVIALVQQDALRDLRSCLNGSPGKGSEKNRD
ncbi:MAG: NAD-binding protein [Halanaerobium sp.]|nr:NAD-binding protein [Halanaerobium sp.]